MTDSYHSVRDYGDNPWQLELTSIDATHCELNETIFALANGFVGLRGNFPEGLPVGSHGTFLNGFHETWRIEHAENAYGFAEIGQTIVNVPDTKTIRLYVDDERLNLDTAELYDVKQTLDLKAGTLARSFTWHTPSGKRVTVNSKRMVSFTHRHITTTEYSVTVDQDANMTISSLIANRQDMNRITPGNEMEQSPVGDVKISDPRKSDSFTERILNHESGFDDGPRSVRAYRTTNSRMGVVVGVDHELFTPDEVEWSSEVQATEDRVRHLFQGTLAAGTEITLVKTSAYDFSQAASGRELVDRCVQQLNEQQRHPKEQRWIEQREFLDRFWERSAVEIHGVDSRMQQAVNWNLFQLAQASARADGRGIPAKGLTGSGYSGHYFWDSEIYVSPFLTYTSPQWARNALRFRERLLPAARARAAELNESGAIFAWRTINGAEASAYYAAGTAQFHINADITYALARYVRATGDTEFIGGKAGDIAIETARMWMSLGFWRVEPDGTRAFHIHGVTGPDEYTTVVNDNLYTNVMARFNLRSALDLLEFLDERSPDEHTAMLERLDVTEQEIDQWRDAEQGMAIHYNETHKIHPQDAHFLELEVWDLAATPPSQKPLLLHFHPLVIYRFQVLKQADVVLAMLLASGDFTADEKRANFEYYDRLTTGDSSLSAVVQSVIAAEVGYHELALDYFHHALLVDLDDLHNNASDGVHIASAGGVWIALVQGFAGLRDTNGELAFDPRLPKSWEALTFCLQWRSNEMKIELTADEIRFTHLSGAGSVPIGIRGVQHVLEPEGTLIVVLENQGPDLGEFPGLSASMLPRQNGNSELEYITTDIPTIEVIEEYESAVHWLKEQEGGDSR